MTDAERAAALADKIEMRGCVDLTPKWGWGSDNTATVALIVSALRAYARPAPADLREAIARVINCVSGMPVCWADEATDAIISLLPQTQAASDVLEALRAVTVELCYCADQLAGFGRKSGEGSSVHQALSRARAILDRAAGKEG